uniref:Kinesin-like protein n=1 Tax=Parascaris univalens TaxID=6257 RepID=A0A914ZSJ5_PARUN
MLTSQSKSEGFSSSGYTAPSGDSASSASSSPSPHCHSVECFDGRQHSQKPVFKLDFDNEHTSVCPLVECGQRRELDQFFGNVYNLYGSSDFSQFRARSHSPTLMTPHVERERPQRGRHSLRPTRLPILMTRSASAANRKSSKYLGNSHSRSFSITSGGVMVRGSQERLADNFEDNAFDVSKRLLDRCKYWKSACARKHFERSLPAPLTRRPRERLYAGTVIQTPQKALSMHDVVRIASGDSSSTECPTSRTMSRSFCAENGEDETQYLPESSFALQCASLAHRIQTRVAHDDPHRSTSSRSISLLNRSSSNQLLPRRSYGYPYNLNMTRGSLYSSDSGVSEGSLDDLDRAHSQWTRRRGRNAGGGMIKPPVERLVALWRSSIGRCYVCRNERRLRRMHVKKGTTKIVKPRVVRRDCCICRGCNISNSSKKRSQNSELNFDRQISLAFIAILIAFLMRIFEILLFQL